MPFSRCFYALPTEPPRTTIYTRFTEAHGQTHTHTHIDTQTSHLTKIHSYCMLSTPCTVHTPRNTDSSAHSDTRHPTHTYKEDTYFNVILVAD